jgi:hypothetical protein
LPGTNLRKLPKGGFFVPPFSQYNLVETMDRDYFDLVDETTFAARGTRCALFLSLVTFVPVIYAAYVFLIDISTRRPADVNLGISLLASSVVASLLISYKWIKVLRLREVKPYALSLTVCLFCAIHRGLYGLLYTIPIYYHVLLLASKKLEYHE